MFWYSLNIMAKQTVSFRLESSKVETLDTLAESLDRDRASLLNEAVAAYLEVQEWQVRHIRESIRHADSGTFVEHDQVRKMAGNWRESQ
jgi:predicted transcriptional regulator